MSPSIRAGLCLALPYLLAPSLPAQSFQGMGDLAGGAFESAALSVSADGSTVVGYSLSAAGRVAVHWKNGVLTPLGDLAGGAVDCIAYGTNQDGSVIVGQGLDAAANRAVRWNSPGYGIVQLPQPAGFSGGATARGISPDGKVISGYATDSQLTSYNNVTAFRNDNGVVTGLPYVAVGGQFDSGAYGNPSADGGVVVGRVRTSFANYAPAYWVGNTLHLPPALDGTTNYSQIFASSADGRVRVGVSQSSVAPITGTGEPCRWVDDVPIALGVVAGSTSAIGHATACNADGSVIVGQSAAAAGSRAFHWSAAGGMRELSLVLAQDYGLNVAGWTLEVAYSITPDGSVIVGWGQNPGGQKEGWIARLGCATTDTYCTAKTNSPGCVPQIFAAGVPSATANGGFKVFATKMLNKMAGLLIYSTGGAASIPFQGGLLCLASPVLRTPGQSSGGSPAGADCSGVYTLDMNTFARGLLGGAPSPLLSVPGTVVHCQYWGRDTGFSAPNNSQLSNGLHYEVCD